ncbi:MAG: DUF4955 domain-containing protein [Cyclobacteriaceae bacterium]
MKSKIFNIILLVISPSIVPAQQSAVWNDFKKSKEENKEAILPDFSFSGYKYSEEAIPDVDFKKFDVRDYGANGNDQKSDKEAIKKAIQAASQNGEGVVFFPRGKYFINTKEDDQSILNINSSRIVLRGEGDDENGSILFFDRDLPPANPTKLWTCPSAIKVSSPKEDEVLTKVISDSKRETFSVEVEDASKIKKNDWVILEVLNNSKDLVKYDVQPLVPEPQWTSILEKGVQINERHQVASVDDNIITFVDPIHYDVQAKHNWRLKKFENLDHVGFEGIRFEGNWLKEFVHHRSAQDDGGWSVLSISDATNSWIRDCTFKNVNRCAGFSSSAACTALDITILGKIGHSGIHASGSTGILLANINDIAGMHHSTGVGGGSTTCTVIWRSKHADHTCFESHASQPRCTLFDNVEGGFFSGRAGGARKNLPNHGRYLVLWNYKETDEPELNFRFWATDSWWWKIVPPIIVGFHGTGTTFKEDEVHILESLGRPVEPESLFEEQLKLRLGRLPAWLVEIKKVVQANNSSR